MKKTFLLLSMFFAVTIFFSTSCDNSVRKNNQQTSKSKVDTLWNEKVQDTFFGATLGDDVSVVKEKFAQHGFYLIKDISSDKLLHFSPQNSRYFSFGNMTWEMLDVEITNGRFSAIIFMNSPKNKQSALRNFNDIKNVVAKKYKLTNIATSDTTVYAREIVFGRNQTRACIACLSYESISEDFRVAAKLHYKTTKDLGDVSDEL